MDETYDAIVLGTGFKECIISGLLSVDGLKVETPVCALVEAGDLEVSFAGTDCVSAGRYCIWTATSIMEGRRRLSILFRYLFLATG